MGEETEITKESLLASAEAHDSAGEFNAEEVSKPETPSSDTSESEVPKPDTEPKLESDAAPTVAEKEGESPKESKPKSKWAANEERKSKTWNEINSDKEALKKDREAFQHDQSRLQSERDEFAKAKASPNSEFRDEKGHTVADYEEAAVRFDEEGEEDLAQLARNKAAKLTSTESEGRKQRVVNEFNQKWAEHYHKIAEKDPDMKIEQSPTYLAVVDLLKRFPLLTQNPDGLAYAYEAVSMSKKGREIEATKAENAKLKDELGKYQKKLSIGGGVATDQPQGERTFDKLSQEQQRKRLMASAEEFDRTMR